MTTLLADENLMRWTLASLALFFMLAAFALLAKKIGPVQLGAVKTGKRRLTLKETLHIDNRHKLCIIEIDGKEKCIAISAENICVISNHVGEKPCKKKCKKTEEVEEVEAESKTSAEVDTATEPKINPTK